MKMPQKRGEQIFSNLTYLHLCFRNDIKTFANVMRNYLIIFLLLNIVLFESCKNSYFQNAEFCMKQHEWEKAKKELLKLIDQNPNNGKSFYLLGEVYGGLNDYEKMCHCFDRSLELTNRFHPKIKYLTQKYWVENYNAGIKSFNKGNFADAIQKFTYATTIRPKKPIAYIQLANIYRVQEDYKKAIETYEQAIRLDKTDTVSRNHLAAIYFRQREYQKAVEICLEIIKLNSSDIEAIKQLAYCFDLMGDRENAIKWYTEASRLSSNDKIIHTNLGIVYFTIHDFPEAIREFRLALKSDSLNTTLYYYLGDCYWKTYDYENMVECFNRIVEIEPKNMNAWRNLVIGYNHLGRFVESDSARARLDKLNQM